MSMATVGTGTARKWPRQRVVLALLIVSAALNLCFVAGAAWTRWHPAGQTSAVPQHQPLAAELALDPRQRAAFDRYVAGMQTRSTSMHREITQLMAGVWDELAKPTVDTRQAERLLDQAAEKRRELVREALTQTVDFLSVLSPVQRSKFIAATRDRRPRWQQPPTQSR